MADRVAFSGDNQSISHIALHHSDLENALRAYFSFTSAQVSMRFIGYSKSDLTTELQERLNEIELSSSMAVLAAVEASFRIDYLQRCQQRRKDPISRAFREIYGHKQTHASLEDDIFGTWIDRFDGARVIIGELRGAFKFRHWLAHGRYWKPKFGRRYDFNDIYTIADIALKHFDLLV
ncbi:hypothetical protein [Rhizobium sp. CECT 9324]|uniref:hypothetical protein n=1 Tax=Rhizobium sp. CECT 9324 TaxID=2845820 RepID=UPI001E6023AF|nr:hypothetical protein [Rhizobium sp. CECT 9324]CAH0341804.1 hypothetical protein RHI9324_03509 [Rhizobium sp. CECT 9324]